MRTLTNGETQIDEDTILLINAAEVLTRDGIHGHIANVGVGFGTGRHTMKRKSPSPIFAPAQQQKQPVK
jgi:hypothetical protein